MTRLTKRFSVLAILALLWVCVTVRCTSKQPGDALTDGNTDPAPILVNCWNPIPENYAVELIALDNGQTVDKQCFDRLKEMLGACTDAGLQPVVCSGYRDIETQTRLYINKVQRLTDQGLSRREAENAAKTEVAYPGTSEHHTGLAVDIVDICNQNLDSTQENTAVQQWLMSHSWEYGFVLRYPDGKSEITGIIYEPWHYRYVGKEAAKIMYEQSLCLEEYVKLMRE